MKKKLFGWQKECLDEWFLNHCRGIVNVVTGAGKTLFALEALATLSDKFKSINNKELQVKIIVPKVFLLRQWAQALKTELDIPSRDIGFYYGNSKEESSKPFMIYVVNSARYSLARHIITDFQNDKGVLLIADECHHYGSAENSRIFDFLPSVEKGCTHYFSLGLSATPSCANYDSILVPALGREIYRYDLQAAKDLVSDFSIIPISISFTEGELTEYETLSGSLRKNILLLRNKCPWLFIGQSESFFAQLEVLASNSSNSSISDIAKSILFLSHRRKEIVYLAEERVVAAHQLIKNLPLSSRIIVFGERIESAELLFQLLKKDFHGEIGKYHSNMSPSIKKLTLQKYESGEIRILISCKALDEGLNVPSTDIGIILSSGNGHRQRIQRLGRILRNQGSGKTAYLYYLYIKESNEKENFFSEKNQEISNILNQVKDYASPKLTSQNYRLDFSSLNSTFSNKFYDNLCSKALQEMKEKGVDSVLIEQAAFQMNIGKFRIDWLLSKEVCQIKLTSATTVVARNYYIAMLLLNRK